MIVDANQDAKNMNPQIPNSDSDCWSITGPKTNLPIWTVPSKKPSNEDKKCTAVEMTGNVNVVNPEEIPFFLNFSWIGLSMINGRE